WGKTEPSVEGRLTRSRPSTRMKKILLSVIAAGLSGMALSSAGGSPIVVNSLFDSTGTDGQCTLREAITNVRNNAQTFTDCAGGGGANTITFSVSGTITLGSTLPPINTTMTIDGSGQTITISGNNFAQVMVVDSGNTLTLLNLAIANGRITGGDGGGINNGGTLNVTNSTFSGNSGTYPSNNNGTPNGGGIYNVGTVNVTNSTFSGNSTTGIGGGIYNFGTLNVTNSTFSGNFSSSSFVGGI